MEKVKCETLVVLDKETSFFFENLDRKKIKVIITSSEFDAFLSNNFQVENIIIFVELDWDRPVLQFHGYQVAQALMESTNRLCSFNLLFISTFKRETIFNIFKNKNRIFTQKFKHEILTKEFSLNNIVIPKISSKKFDYLKNYCLLESGVLDRLEHEVRNLLGSNSEAKLIKAIEEIKANKDILTPQIISKTEMLENTDDIQIREKLLHDIHRFLQVLQNQINNPGESSEKKSHARVMLIDDDKATLINLHKQLGQYFRNITPFHNGSVAFDELKKNARQYDVVITDMELLEENFDDEKQGIDILELCENQYPFIVTRVITALPKNALKRLIGKGISEIIFKSSTGDSVIPPFENLVEFVNQIEKEVLKRKQLRNMQGPENSWWGKYLTKQLYITKIDESEKYNKIWQNAINQANGFINGEFDTLNDIEKISTEFKQTNEVSNNPESGWEIIELLLSHRLISLWFSTKHSWNDFYYSGSGEDNVYVKLNGFKSGLETKSSKLYFNTLLGLSVRGASRDRKEILQCNILPKNLFPEEIQWLSRIKSSNLESFLLREVNDDFHEMFIDFMKSYKMEKICDDITFGEAMEMLDDFIINFPEERPNSERLYTLKKKFNLNLDDFYELLPSEAKTRLEKIKLEILNY